MATSSNPASSTTLAAELRGVSRLYGTFAALRDVSAVFPAGTCTVLLGPNGAGKSTLLRVLAGLSTPTRGSVTVFGDQPHKHRGRIAYMSHASMLYDELSAMENLTYFASLDTTRECDCAGSPEMALRAVGLDPNLRRPVGQYSQGMRQRASFARVLQADPQLLLLDEPFSNMDTASVQLLVSLLTDFRTWAVAGGGARTVVLTTHQSHLALPLADSVLTLDRGRLVNLERGATGPIETIGRATTGTTERAAG